MRIESLPLSLLRTPDWYLKRQLDAIQLHKLAQSCKVSHGVLFVRQTEDYEGYEIIDGVQRMRALVSLGRTEAICEVVEFNIPRCILMAWQRNANWNDIEVMKLAQVVTSYLKEYFDPKKLTLYLPEGELELQALTTLLNFRWEDFTQTGKGNAQQGSLFEG